MNWPSGEAAAKNGRGPVGIRASSVWVTVSSTLTSFELRFGTAASTKPLPWARAEAGRRSATAKMAKGRAILGMSSILLSR
jgi:hypothetical protein